MATTSPAIDWQKLRAAARDAQQHSYAPYSKFRVGAAALINDGRIIAGCNVEMRPTDSRCVQSAQSWVPYICPAADALLLWHVLVTTQTSLRVDVVANCCGSTVAQTCSLMLKALQRHSASCCQQPSQSIPTLKTQVDHDKHWRNSFTAATAVVQ